MQKQIELIELNYRANLLPKIITKMIYHKTYVTFFCIRLYILLITFKLVITIPEFNY